MVEMYREFVYELQLRNVTYILICGLRGKKRHGSICTPKYTHNGE